MRTRGDEEATRRDVVAALDPVDRSGNVLLRLWIAAALGLLELSLGHAAPALDACRPLIEGLEERGIGEPVPAFFLPEALEAMVVLGEVDRVEALIDQPASGGFNGGGSGGSTSIAASAGGAVAAARSTSVPAAASTAARAADGSAGEAQPVEPSLPEGLELSRPKMDRSSRGVTAAVASRAAVVEVGTAAARRSHPEVAAASSPRTR
jgi:hypothetical protein